MKKVILYLEDDANMRRHTTRLLEEEDYFKEKGYIIEDFRRIDQVKEYFINRMNDIACIVTDLNMDDEFLEEYIAESEGGMLSGWVFLQRFVYPKKTDIPVIIYSGYISFLKEYLENNDLSDMLNSNTIGLVDKGANEGDGYCGLKTALRKVLERGGIQ